VRARVRFRYVTCFNSGDGCLGFGKQDGIPKKKHAAVRNQEPNIRRPRHSTYRPFPLDPYNTSVPKIQKTWSGRVSKRQSGKTCNGTEMFSEK